MAIFTGFPPARKAEHTSLTPKVTGRYCRGVGDPECAKINGMVVLEFSNSALNFSIDLYSVSLIAL